MGSKHPDTAKRLTPLTQRVEVLERWKADMETQAAERMAIGKRLETLRREEQAARLDKQIEATNAAPIPATKKPLRRLPPARASVWWWLKRAGQRLWKSITA